MMKSEGKRGNPILTVILVLIVLILGLAGGVFLSRGVNGGFLGDLMGNTTADQGTVPDYYQQQTPAQPAATAPVVNPAGAQVPGTASNQTPVSAEAVETDNVVSGDGALTAQDGVDVLTPAAVTIIQLPVKAGDEVTRGDVLARVDKDKLQDTLNALKAQRDDQEQVVRSLSGNKASETVYSPVKGRVKKVFADEGEDVQTVIARDGSLALLSTDGLMKVTFVPAAGTDVRVGAAVTVKDDRGNEWDGRIASLSGATGEITVTFSDDGPELDETVSVYLGALIGTGTARINSPLTITATGGTVDDAKYWNKENSSVSKGTALFVLKDVPISDDYKTALTKRQDILDQIIQAEDVLDSGEITAPESGIIDVVYPNITNVPLGKDTAILSLSSDETLDMVITVDEMDVVNLEVGQSATVTVNALGGQTFSGSVKKIAFVGRNVGGITMYDVHPDGQRARNAGRHERLRLHRNRITNGTSNP
jgi:multidrug efflux pump subunit AcrA (membrane-fusion protein)